MCSHRRRMEPKSGIESLTYGSLIRDIEELSENCLNYNRTRNCQSVDFQVIRSRRSSIESCSN